MMGISVTDGTFPSESLTHIMTLAVNLEGREGGHCCGGGIQPAETVIIITPTRGQSCLEAIFTCERNNNREIRATEGIFGLSIRPRSLAGVAKVPLGADGRARRNERKKQNSSTHSQT